jgi:hypothetical protein
MPAHRFAHLETGQYKNSPRTDLMQQKGARKKKHHHLQPRKKFADKPRDNWRISAGLPCVNLVNQMMNQKNLFMFWSLKTQMVLHFGGRDQPILWTNQLKPHPKLWFPQRRYGTNQGQRKLLERKDSHF